MSNYSATIYAHDFNAPGALLARSLLKTNGWRITLSPAYGDHTSFSVVTTHGTCNTIEEVEELVSSMRQPR